MNNYKKTSKGGSIRPRTVDGIISPKASYKVDTNRPPKTQNTLQNTGTSIGNFNRNEGFHSLRQNKIQPAMNEQNTKLKPNNQNSNLNLPPESPRNKTKKKWSRRKRIFWVFATLIIIFAAITGFLFAKGYLSLRHVLKGGTAGAPALQQNVDPTKLNGEGDGRVNILLLGKGGDGHDGPDLTDTILVASIDPVQNTAAILSIPRDLYVKESPGGSPVKINQIYADAKYRVLAGKNTPDRAQRAEDAGFKAIESTVSTTMGIPVHYHVMVDFKAFRDAVNTVGGIDVNAPSAVRETLWLEDTGKNYVLDVKPGLQHFDGQRALAYARSRHTSPRGDFDRTERQRAMLVALKEKVMSLGTYSNPIRISQLIDAFGNHIETNLNVNEMKRLYAISKNIDNSKVVSIGLADPPNSYVTTSNINGLSVVIPRAGIYNYSDIQSYVRNTLKDSYLLSENASITVLNGTTTPGAATKRANELKSYGYNVTTIGDAPTKDYQKTTLVDLTGGSKKYTKHYLEQRLGITAVSQLPSSSISPGSANFVIIVGQDENTTN